MTQRQQDTLADAVRRLREDTKTVLREVIKGDRVSLLDYPDYPNFGDSLIYLGQMAYLDELGIKVDYISEITRFRPASMAHQLDGTEHPILLQGGGNLGDRWVDHNDFRNRIVAEFPERSVVLLPQSCDFRSRSAARETASVWAAHPDATLLLRDHVSMAAAGEIFDNPVRFCPDMAFGIGPQERTAQPDTDVVFLRRADTETVLSQERLTALFPDALFCDWHYTRFDTALNNAARVVREVSARTPASGLTYRPAHASYRAQAEWSLGKARKVLSRGRIVVTDRLHASVLAALMSIPVIALDNANGKISAAHQAYLHRLPGFRFAENLEQAREFADELLHRPA